MAKVKVFGLICNTFTKKAFTLPIKAILFFGVQGSVNSQIALINRKRLTTELNESALSSAKYLENLLLESSKLLYSVELRFHVEHVGINSIDGRSMDLAFALAFAVEFVNYKQQTFKKNFAATGELNSEGKIEGIKHINEKIIAALEDLSLTHGDLIFYPKDNHKEIKREVKIKAGLRGINLISVDNLPIALRNLGLKIPIPYSGEPYLGLETYKNKHSAVFAGRDDDIKRILNKLFKRIKSRQLNLLIVGSSGSGKSSLVYAGLIHRMEQGISGLTDTFELSHSTDCLWSNWYPRGISSIDSTGNQKLLALIQSILLGWGKIHGIDCEYLKKSSPDNTEEAVKITPNDLSNILESSLPRHNKDTTQIVWVVDQFEEIFTYNYPIEIQEWLKELIITLNNRGVWVISTLRNDFFEDYQSSCFKGLFGDEGIATLSAPRNDAIRQIISNPAKLVGITFEGEEDDDCGESLIDRIIDDVGSQTDVLPLLELTLKELYKKRDIDSQKLTFDAYNSLGNEEGAEGAEGPGQSNTGSSRNGLFNIINYYSGEIFKNLDEEAKNSFAKFIRQIVCFDYTSKNIISRSIPLEIVHSDQGLKRLIDHFMVHHLLIQNNDQSKILTIVHDAVLSHWTHAANTINDNKEYLQEEARLKVLFNQWKQQKEKAINEDNLNSLLIPEGLHLSAAQQFLSQFRTELEDDFSAYIHESIECDKRKRLREISKQKKRLKILLVSSLLIITILLILGNQIQSKNEHYKTSQSQYLIDQAKQANSRGEFDLAMLLSLNALPGDYGGNRPYVKGAIEQVTTAMANTQKIAEFIHRSAEAPCINDNGSFITINKKIATLSDKNGHLIREFSSEGFISASCFSASGNNVLISEENNITIKSINSAGQEEIMGYRQPIIFTGKVLSASLSEENVLSVVTREMKENSEPEYYIESIIFNKNRLDEDKKRIKGVKKLIRVIRNKANDALLIIHKSDDLITRCVSLWKRDELKRVQCSKDRHTVKANWSFDQKNIMVGAELQVFIYDSKNIELIKSFEHTLIQQVIFLPSSSGYEYAYAGSSNLKIYSNKSIERTISFTDDFIRDIDFNQHKSTFAVLLSQIKDFNINSNIQHINVINEKKIKSLISVRGEEAIKSINFIGNNILAQHNKYITIWRNNTPNRVTVPFQRHNYSFHYNHNDPSATLGKHLGDSFFINDNHFNLLGVYWATVSILDKDANNTALEHEKNVYTAQFSSDGRKILTASKDKTAVIWSKNGDKVHTLVHDNPVKSALFTKSNDVITAAGNFVYLFHQGDPTKRNLLFRDSSAITHMALHGRILITKNINNLTCLRRLNGELIRCSQHNTQLSNNGHWVVYHDLSDLKGPIKILNVETDQEFLLITESKEFINSFSINNSHLALGFSNGQVDIYSLKTKQKARSFIVDRSFSDIQLSPLNTDLLITYANHAALWSSKNAELTQSFRTLPPLTSAKFINKGHSVVTLGQEAFQVWHVYDDNNILDLAIKSLPIGQKHLSSENRHKFYLD